MLGLLGEELRDGQRRLHGLTHVRWRVRLRRQRDRKEAVARAVVEEDAGEARADEGADAQLRKAPDGMLTARSTAASYR